MPAARRQPAVVDVREDLRQGRHPLGRILQAVKALVGGQDLLLLASFEPVPLYKVLALRGFEHHARQLPGGEWEVCFRRRGRRDGNGVPEGSPSAPPATGRREPAPSSGAPPAEDEARWTRLDNRGLEPPEPMIRTFSALGVLAPGEVLEIHNDRRPLFLYPHLEEREFRFQTVDQEDGSARVRIWHPADGAGADARPGVTAQAQAKGRGR